MQIVCGNLWLLEDSFEPGYSSGRAEIAIKYEELRKKAVFQQCMLSLGLPMSMSEKFKTKEINVSHTRCLA